MFNYNVLKRTNIREKGEIIMKKICAFIAVFVVSLLFISNVVSGKTSEINDQMFYYKKVIIVSGDTLWSLAEEYNDGQYSDIRDYIYQIKKFNNISSNNIKAGESIIIPIMVN